MKQSITILHLYASEMNIYGDLGNIITLSKRLEWRGIEAKVLSLGIGDEIPWGDVDLVFAGGGQDRGQIAVGVDLQLKSTALGQAADSGLPMLVICGSYQLFGHSFLPAEGDEIKGIGIFSAHTVASTHRMIGNVAIESPWGELVGFENHSGKTYLDPEQAAFGRVVRGFGNDASSGFEGAVVKSVYGTYLHGPLLPKNPRFADHLLQLAVGRKYPRTILAQLDDSLEIEAYVAARLRPL